MKPLSVYDACDLRLISYDTSSPLKEGVVRHTRVDGIWVYFESLFQAHNAVNLQIEPLVGVWHISTFSSGLGDQQNSLHILYWAITNISIENTDHEDRLARLERLTHKLFVNFTTFTGKIPLEVTSLQSEIEDTQHWHGVFLPNCSNPHLVNILQKIVLQSKGEYPPQYDYIIQLLYNNSIKYNRKK